MFGLVGEWVRYFDEAIRDPRPTDIRIKDKEEDFLLKKDNTWYLFCHHLPMLVDPNVGELQNALYLDEFELPAHIQSVEWMDNGKSLPFEQEGNHVKIHTEPFRYGTQLVVRVAKIVTEGGADA